MCVGERACSHRNKRKWRKTEAGRDRLRTPAAEEGERGGGKEGKGKHVCTDERLQSPHNYATMRAHTHTHAQLLLTSFNYHSARSAHQPQEPGKVYRKETQEEMRKRHKRGKGKGSAHAPTPRAGRRRRANNNNKELKQPLRRDLSLAFSSLSLSLSPRPLAFLLLFLRLLLFK